MISEEDYLRKEMPFWKIARTRCTWMHSFPMTSHGSQIISIFVMEFSVLKPTHSVQNDPRATEEDQG